VIETDPSGWSANLSAVSHQPDAMEFHGLNSSLEVGK